MEEKRYSIVRVDMRCPYGLEETFCSNDCHRCRLCYGYYGETKNQLIKKVAQVIRKRTDNGIIVRYREDSISVEELAKEIVESLGVK